MCCNDTDLWYGAQVLKDEKQYCKFMRLWYTVTHTVMHTDFYGHSTELLETTLRSIELSANLIQYLYF